MDGGGRARWGGSGVAPVPGHGSTNASQLSSDRSGGAIVAGLDGAGLYLNRVAADGNLPWGNSKLISSTAGGPKPGLAPDGFGGAYIVCLTFGQIPQTLDHPVVVFGCVDGYCRPKPVPFNLDPCSVDQT